MPRATILQYFLFTLLIRLLSTQKQRDFRKIKSKSSEVKFRSRISVLKPTKDLTQSTHLVVFAKGY